MIWAPIIRAVECYWADRSVSTAIFPFDDPLNNGINALTRSSVGVMVQRTGYCSQIVVEKEKKRRKSKLENALVQ